MEVLPAWCEVYDSPLVSQFWASVTKTSSKPITQERIDVILDTEGCVVKQLMEADPAEMRFSIVALAPRLS